MNISHLLAASLLVVLSACGTSSPVATAPATQAQAGTETVTEDGYITLADGIRLRYHMERLLDAPPGPVVMQYDGYDAGTGGYFSNIPEVKASLMSRGYVILGVSIRGTGCSSGSFDLFDPQWSKDGYDAVEWAARQPWSDGNVGMIGYSYPGIMQLFVAATRPPHLRAIAPANVIFDLYRDVGAPGGILNSAFATLFTGQQEAPGLEGQETAIEQGDPECAQNHVANRAAYQSFAVAGLQSPHIDGPFGYFKRSPMSTAANIEVPVLTVDYWQDEQTGSRIGGLLEAGGLLDVLNLDTTWTVVSNGNHDITEGNPMYSESLEKFYDHYLRGIDNGWERTPHIRVQHELGTTDRLPSWVTQYDAIPQVTPASLYFRDGGTLLAQPPSTPEASASYVYPAPSPSNNPLPWASTELDALWQQPVAQGGYVTFTTPVLARDFEVLGSASVDVWLSSTATDTDLQGTITEVRPDGQELYVARGWLRASKRALDEARSTPTRPFHDFTEATVANLVANEPTLMRLEIFPFGHRFRAGSALRLIIDAPTGTTGDWGFLLSPQPAVNTILLEPGHVSKLTLGLLAGGPTQVPPERPCGEAANQACRASIAPVPAGSLSFP